MSNGKTHLGMISKATGQVQIVGGIKCQREAYRCNNVVKRKLFEELPAEQKCHHCTSMYARIAARMARNVA